MIDKIEAVNIFITSMVEVIAKEHPCNHDYMDDLDKEHYIKERLKDIANEIVQRSSARDIPLRR